jgi:hypothetical protein
LSVGSSSHTLITNGVITPPQSSQEVSIFDRVSSWASTLDYHDGLTALSVVPIVGAVAGVVDAAGYALEGDYSTAATMLAVGMIPGGKLGMKFVGKPVNAIFNSVGALRKKGLKDAHHIIQDAAVKHLPGYKTNAAPGIQLPGPASKKATPHYIATQVQRQLGGGTYASERRIGYKAMRRAGISREDARYGIKIADEYFERIGVTQNTITRRPGNRY